MLLLRASLAAAAVVAAAGATSATRADSPRDGQLVDVDAKYLFVPIGFDDNDEAVVTVDGYLPSGCYRLTRPEVAVDHATRTITVRPMARYFDVPCIEALVPFHFDVALGVLAEGRYTVVANADGGLTESLPVKEATSAGPDDYLYAPVDDVSVAEDRQTGKLTATIAGRLTSSCLQWQELKVEDNGKTVNILPIIQATSGDGNGCVATETSFKKSVELPDSIAPGRHLLHVRSLNGRAVSFVFFKAAPRRGGAQ